MLGSLGAREMNKKIAEFMKCEAEAGEPFQHLHATGSFGWRWMPQYVKDLGLDLSKHPAIDMREYIFNMPTAMAAADLIICRAGLQRSARSARARCRALWYRAPM